MDYTFHYLLMAAQGLFQRNIILELNGSGLTAGQPKVLDYLGLHDGSVQKDIAIGCQIDPATLTGLLNRMEEKGLIQRRNNPGDRRSLHVYLTEKGWEKQKEVRRVLEYLDQKILSGLPPEEQQRLLEGLLYVCKAFINVEELQ